MGEPVWLAHWKADPARMGLSPRPIHSARHTRSSRSRSSTARARAQSSHAHGGSSIRGVYRHWQWPSLCEAVSRIPIDWAPPPSIIRRPRAMKADLIITRHPALIRAHARARHRRRLDVHPPARHDRRRRGHASSLASSSRTISPRPARTVTLQILLAITPEERGVELTVERLREIGGEAVTTL